MRTQDQAGLALRCANPRKTREGGSALLIATILVIIVVGVTGAFLADSVFKQKTAQTAIGTDEAALICDAVLEKVRRALFVYKTTQVGSGSNQVTWDNMLSWSSGNTNPDSHWQMYQSAINTTTFTNYRANWNTTGLNTANEAPQHGSAAWFFDTVQPFGKGAFFATIVNNKGAGDTGPQFGAGAHDGDGQLLVFITGMLPDKTIKQIEALVLFVPSNWSSPSAIISDGAILLNGSPTVNGSLGSVFSNADLFITGSSVNIAVSGSAAGFVSVTGNPPTPSGGWNSGVAPQTLPDVVPSSLKANPSNFPIGSSYVLMNDGTMRTFDGGVTGAVVSPTGGWSFSSGQWSLSGSNTAPNGVYYVDSGGTNGLGGGNVKITGQGNAFNKTMTIIAEGSVTTTGNVSITPALSGTTILSGRDIDLGGTAGAISGLIAAHEQVRVHGNFSLNNGSILSKDAEDLSTLISSSSSVDPGISDGVFDSGNTTITYNTPVPSIIPNPNNSVSIQNVRRLR